MYILYTCLYIYMCPYIGIDVDRLYINMYVCDVLEQGAISHLHQHILLLILLMLLATATEPWPLHPENRGLLCTICGAGSLFCTGVLITTDGEQADGAATLHVRHCLGQIVS